MLVFSPVTLLNTILLKNSKFTKSLSLLFNRSTKIYYYSTNSKFNAIQTSKNKNYLFLNTYQAMTTNALEKKEEPKKVSKFKMAYQQYGPSFVVIHLVTVVAWIYFFYFISKQ